MDERIENLALVLYAQEVNEWGALGGSGEEHRKLRTIAHDCLKAATIFYEEMGRMDNGSTTERTEKEQHRMPDQRPARPKRPRHTPRPAPEEEPEGTHGGIPK
jgi:hypothetical protein